MNHVKSKNLTKIALSIIVVAMFSGFFKSEPADIQLLPKTDFETIGLRKDPGIVLSHGDTISNREAGKIDMKGSVIQAKYFLGEQKTFTGSFWEVSSDFVHNADLKKSNDLQATITAIDSGYIFVHKGVYGKITGKSNVTIIGVSPDQVFITSTNDSTLVYGNGLRNFNLRNITIMSTGASSGIDKALINLVNCYVDSLTSPKIVFDNIRIIGVNNDNIYGIKADSSRFSLTNSYVSVSNTANANGRACIFIRKGSNPYVDDNILICDDGQPADRIFNFEDTRCRIAFYNNKMNVTAGALMSDGVSIYVRAAYNICNESFTGFENLIASGYNVEDAAFFIR